MSLHLEASWSTSQDVGKYVADPHSQQTKNQMQTDIDQPRNILRIPRQQKSLQSERRKRRASTKNTNKEKEKSSRHKDHPRRKETNKHNDKEKEPSLGSKGRPRLRDTSQKTDDETTQHINGQSAVGKPRIVQRSVHPDAQSIA